MQEDDWTYNPKPLTKVLRDMRAYYSHPENTFKTTLEHSRRKCLEDIFKIVICSNREVIGSPEVNKWNLIKWCDAIVLSENENGHITKVCYDELMFALEKEKYCFKFKKKDGRRKNTSYRLINISGAEVLPQPSDDEYAKLIEFAPLNE